MFSCETPTAFFVPSHSLFYFLSSLTSSVGMWLSERERRKGWKSAEQMNEQSVVWYQGRVDCSVESRDRRRKRKPTAALGLLCTGEAR